MINNHDVGAHDLQSFVISLLESTETVKLLPKMRPTRSGLVLRFLHLQAHIVHEEIDEGTANEVSVLLDKITLVIEQK